MDRCLHMAKSNKLEKSGRHCPLRRELEEVEERIYALQWKNKDLWLKVAIMHYIACNCLHSILLEYFLFGKKKKKDLQI